MEQIKLTSNTQEGIMKDTEKIEKIKEILECIFSRASRMCRNCEAADVCSYLQAAVFCIKKKA